MKCEANAVSGHVSRFKAPFLRKFFSLPNLPLQSVALFPCWYSILLLLLSHLIFDLSAPRFVLCLHLHLSYAFLAAHFLGRLAHILALPWTTCVIQKHLIYSQRIHNKPLLIGLTFHWHFYQSSHKTWCLSAAPDTCHSFFRQPYTTDTYYFLCCSGTNDSFGLEHVQMCLSTRVCLTRHPSDTLRLFRELNCHTMYIVYHYIYICSGMSLEFRIWWSKIWSKGICN